MKLLLLLAFFTATAVGFSPSSMATRRGVVVTRLHAASGLPQTKFGSTEPVADRPVSKMERNRMKDRMIDPDYTLTIGTAALCPLIIWYHSTIASHLFVDQGIDIVGVAGGLFHIVFAALLWVQTRRVRLVFEKDAMEFYNIKGHKLDLENGAKLTRKPDNYVAGTHNRWKYDTITNYGFFPSLDFPFIIYFKETETDEVKWDKWFAAFDPYGRGQPHFFPGICNARQIKHELEARGVKRKPIPTFKTTQQQQQK